MAVTKQSLFFYRPFVSLSQITEFAEAGIVVSELCGLCVSSEAGGQYIRHKKFLFFLKRIRIGYWTVII